jgi:hypothetical protein
MAWRVAKSLLVLRKQVDQAFPERSKEADGTIGDANHSARTSDHNPDVDGVVKAMDITHDPDNGVDSYLMAEQLRASRDPRIKYIISDRKICSSIQSPWMWRPYRGSNPHDHHVHISVRPDRSYFDNERPWQLPMLTGKPVGLVGDVEEGDPPRKTSLWKKIAAWGSGFTGFGGLSLYDWRVAAALGSVALIVFLVVWFTFLRDYLKRQR